MSRHLDTVSAVAPEDPVSRYSALVAPNERFLLKQHFAWMFAGNVIYAIVLKNSPCAATTGARGVRQTKTISKLRANNV